MYLNDWKDGGFIDMVADFEGIYITKSEYDAEKAPYPNVRYWLEEKQKLKDALASDRWQGIEVLLASYGYQNYSGDAFVLFRKDGKLYEINASHCSYYGLEGCGFNPEETTIESLMHRLDNGSLGKDETSGNEFGKELREILVSMKMKSMARKKIPDDERKLKTEAMLDLMHSGKPAVTACEEVGLKFSTFLLWVSQDKALADMYAHAREALIEKMAADTMRISDEPVGSVTSGGMDSAAVAKQRLQVDTRKWLLSKLAPRKYGEKLEISGDSENPIAVTAIERTIVKAGNSNT